MNWDRKVPYDRCTTLHGNYMVIYSNYIIGVSQSLQLLGKRAKYCKWNPILSLDLFTVPTIQLSDCDRESCDWETTWVWFHVVSSRPFTWLVKSGLQKRKACKKWHEFQVDVQIKLFSLSHLQFHRESQRQVNKHFWACCRFGNYSSLAHLGFLSAAVKWP